MSISSTDLRLLITDLRNWAAGASDKWLEQSARKSFLKVRTDAITQAVINHPGAPPDVQIREAQQYEAYIRNGGPPRDAGT